MHTTTKWRHNHGTVQYVAKRTRQYRPPLGRRANTCLHILFPVAIQNVFYFCNNILQAIVSFYNIALDAKFKSRTYFLGVRELGTDDNGNIRTAPLLAAEDDWPNRSGAQKGSLRLRPGGWEREIRGSTPSTPFFRWRSLIGWCSETGALCLLTCCCPGRMSGLSVQRKCQ